MDTTTTPPFAPADGNEVQDTNPFATGHEFHLSGVTGPTRIEVRRPGRYQVSMSPAPDPRAKRGQTEAGGRWQPSAEWKPGERIALLNMAAEVVAECHQRPPNDRAGGVGARMLHAGTVAVVELAAGIYLAQSSEAGLPYSVHIREAV